MTTTNEDGATEGATTPNRRDRRVAIAATALTLLPIVVAVIRAVASDWVPVGDNSLTVMRAYDVIHGPQPLLGSWTSASKWSGVDMNMPGPTLFQAIAVPVWLFGPFKGAAIGAGLVNGAAVIACATFAWRMGRLPLLLLTNIGVVTLLASMGSSNLVDPWNANIATLSFLVLLFATAALLTGDVWGLPVAAAAATFVLQAHLSYVLLAPGLAALGIAGLAWSLWQRRQDPDGSPSRTRVVTGVGVTALVLVAGWSLPLYEQITPNPGNFTKLYRASQVTPPPAPGLGQSIGAVSLVLARPPLWFAPGWGDTKLDLFHPAPVGFASTLLVGSVLVALVCVAVMSYRRSDSGAWALATTAAVGLLLTIATAAKGTSPFGLQLAYVRYVWPMSMLSWLAVLYGVARSPWLASRLRSVFSVREQQGEGPTTRLARPVSVVGVAVLAVATLLALPARHYAVDAPKWAEAPSRRFAAAAVEAVRGRRGARVDLGLAPSAALVGPPVMAALVEAGYDVRTTDDVLTYQIGHQRLFRPERDSNLPVLAIVKAAPRPGPAHRVRLLASMTGLDSAQTSDLAELTRRFVQGVRRDGGLRWSDDPATGSDVRRSLQDIALRSPAELLHDARLLRDQRGRLLPPTGMSPGTLDDLFVLAGLRLDRSISLYLVERD
ncbi:MAG: hypothetical protein KDB02_01850 [Acidimicrobiales bacterium]|nr:hypothetical protein [Acidimicrobiales bacterium]